MDRIGELRRRSNQIDEKTIAKQSNVKRWCAVNGCVMQFGCCRFHNESTDNSTTIVWFDLLHQQAVSNEWASSQSNDRISNTWLWNDANQRHWITMCRCCDCSRRTAPLHSIIWNVVAGHWWFETASTNKATINFTIAIIFAHLN